LNRQARATNQKGFVARSCVVVRMVPPGDKKVESGTGANGTWW